RRFGNIAAHGGDPDSHYDAKHREREKESWNVAAGCGGGNQKRASNHPRAPKEVQQIQRCASALGVRGRNQQVGGRNYQTKSCTVGCNTENTNDLWSGEKKGDSQRHEYQTEVDGEAVSPAGYEDPSKRHGPGSGQVLGIK